ncbi:hypothetical protein B0H10DRAFT_2221327 [Mycena sp. CBHHK59/15]|nr:hypothetical protein B0H10DRAFT_2221327 [Mycena sp. CBHHK59/15]
MQAAPVLYSPPIYADAAFHEMHENERDWRMDVRKTTMRVRGRQVRARARGSAGARTHRYSCGDNGARHGYLRLPPRSIRTMAAKSTTVRPSAGAWTSTTPPPPPDTYAKPAPPAPFTISLLCTSTSFNGGFAITNTVYPQDNKAVIVLPDVVPGYVSSLYPSIRLHRILTPQSLCSSNTSYAPHPRANFTLPLIYRPGYTVSFVSMCQNL